MIQELVTSNWITIYLLFLLGVLVVVNYLFPIRFRDFYVLHNTSQYLIKYQSTTNVLFSFNLALLLFQIIVYSFLILKIYPIIYGPIVNEFLFFLKIITVYSGFLTARYILGKIVCTGLNLVKEQEEVSFRKTTYLSKLSVYIFPFIICGFYLPFDTNYLFIIITIVLLLFCLFYYFIILKYYREKMFIKWYYFILYLCALEITPIFLLYKALV